MTNLQSLIQSRRYAMEHSERVASVVGIFEASYIGLLRPDQVGELSLGNFLQYFA